MHSVMNPDFDEDASDLDKLMDMVVNIGLNAETDGCLLCAEPNSHRIWQKDECRIMYFIAKSLAAQKRLS